MAKRKPKAKPTADRPVYNLCGPVMSTEARWRDGVGYRELTRGERVCAWLEELRVPEGDLVGRFMRLLPEQIAFVRAIYDNEARTRRAVLSIARKNGKSSLLAGLLLVHLVGPEARPNAQLVSGAMSRDQASLIHRLASQMGESSPLIREQIRYFPSGKRLLGLATGSEYKALAADGKTSQGLSPQFAILDEIGQVRGQQSEFVSSILTAQGAYQHPLCVVISTQAASDNDLLSLWLDDAAVSDDARLVAHLHSAPAEADLMDESAWKLANPGLGIFRSYGDLRDELKQASRMPSAESSARNLLLNQRVTTQNPFVAPDVWKRCAGEPKPLAGMPVYAGLDLSMRTDLTALVLIGFEDDGTRHVHAVFWTPEQGIVERGRHDRMPYPQWHRQGYLRTTNGKTVDYADVARDIVELVDGLDLKLIAFDRWRIELLRKELEQMGVTLPLEPYGQGYKDMSPGLDQLEADLLNERIRHGSHPLLAQCAASAVVLRDPAGNRKLDRARANGRIDGLVAMTMALGAAGMQEPVTDPEYQMFVL